MGTKFKQSTSIHASTCGEHLPPRPLTQGTLAAHSLEHHQLQPSDTNECRGLKCTKNLEGIEEGSTTSGLTAKKRRNKAKRDKRNDEAQNHCRNLILDWFRKQNMVYLEKQYLNDGIKGLDLVKTKLKLLLLEGRLEMSFKKIGTRANGANELKNKWWKQSTIQ